MDHREAEPTRTPGNVPDRLETYLSDGTAVLFRPLEPSDRSRLQEAFERLSPRSRYRRFFRYVDRLSEQQLDYLTKIDYENHFAWAAVLRDVAGQPGIGVARWIRVKGEPEVAEAAVTVIDEYQNKGIGSTLLYLAGVSAIARGIRWFRAWTLGENKPMIELLTELGAVPGQWESGVLELNVPLPEKASGMTGSAAPLILRAVASGHLLGEADPEEVGRMRFIDHNAPAPTATHDGTKEDRGSKDDGIGAPDRI